MNLSKSKYTTGVTCDKKLWLSCYKSEVAEDTSNETVLENGNEIGELSRNIFGKYILVDYEKGFQSMIEETNKLLDKKPNIICEASFSYDGNFCSIDILKNDKDGVEIYEVKSSSDVKSIYIDDISYQTWVLKKCGLKVKKSYLVYLNKEYILDGELDINRFFNIEDVTELINLDDVEDNVDRLKEIINIDKEPYIDLSMSCHNPYPCSFFNYCTRNLPKPNVFDLGWNLRFDKKIDMYKRDHISY